MIFEGRCWKFGHNIPTDEITPTHVVWKSFAEMAKHVLESLNPEFPQKVQKGDIIVVPAGTPHWFKQVPKSVNYLVVKALKP